MAVDAFVDTNVLIYSVSSGEDEARKRAMARQVLAASGWRSRYRSFRNSMSTW
jgi:predicted nucleic acid-binding protein